MSAGEPIELHAAMSVLRGQTGATTREQRVAAERRVVREVEDLTRVKVWAYKLLDALAAGDDVAVERARRGLAEALGE
ncbi:hypothetical protein [Pseudonocardia sp. McavD-2-B]|uniref:hypothetical protein n=1 Tax=Pseudonocardia sp. McavD-2-B TaxID=2954499 RepID=UPI0020978B09|nr:hypothetical protein [Pseudonocardia sp. McavD-2-B]MCO7195047.1 hypothetical protein [Pseudonocardia sp. McavD-2-B]